MSAKSTRALLACASAAVAITAAGAAHADDPVAPTARAVGAYEGISTARPPDDTQRLRLQAGMSAAYGNARSFGFNIAGRYMLRRSEHQLVIEGAYNYGFAYNYPSTVMAGSTRQESTLADNLVVRPRYDLFLTPNNALFLSAQLFRDAPGGIEYRLSGQFGYLRNLVNVPDKHRFWVELGIDAAHEQLAQPDTQGRLEREGLSARVFVGHTEHVAPVVDFDIGVEGLLNFLNLSPTVDFRLNALANLSARLTPSLSVGWSLALRYNSVPPPFLYVGPNDPNNIYRDTLDFNMLITVVYQASLDPPPPPPPPAPAATSAPAPAPAATATSNASAPAPADSTAPASGTTTTASR